MKIEFKDYTFEQAAIEFGKENYCQPTEEKIGVFTATDYNGTGEFRWLKNWDELKYYMLNIWFPTLTDERDDNYYRYIDEIQNKLMLMNGDVEQIKVLANENPYDETEIKWIGKIDELIKDEGFFAEQVKDHFNENKPINDSNRSDFIAFLKNYVWA